MFELHSVTSVTKKRKRVGRGGSRGGSSGKGTKGQNARSGGLVRPGFEGGQMPLHRRLPKRGFTNIPFRVITEIVNLRDLERVFVNGATISRTELIEKGLIKPKHGIAYRVKLLGDGVVSKSFQVLIDLCSEKARLAINNAGGSVQIAQAGE